MKKKLEQQELTEALESLIQWNALEIEKDDDRLLIPHIMNDAVEQYIIFEECRMQGEPDKEDIALSRVKSVVNNDISGIIIRQPKGNVITIWYRQAVLFTGCYRYHLIGHKWRREQGQEYLRRLVNLLCVLHDKKTYLGEEYCDETEKTIAFLAEFQPVIYFTPINESILDWYPGTGEGIKAAKIIADEAGDDELLKELHQYEALFLKGKIKNKHIEKFADKLTNAKHMIFWKKIDELITLASLKLTERSYGTAADQKIGCIRANIAESYHRKGYEGTYPRLYRTDKNKTDAKKTDSGRTAGNRFGNGSTENNTVMAADELYFTEQHPFTVMESDDYKFKVFSMNIKNGDIIHCTWKEEDSGI